MYELLFAFFALSILFMDGVFALFKRLSLGNLAARLKDLDHEAGLAIFICIFCCPVFSFSLTSFFWKSAVISRIVYPITFLFVAYIIYRPAMLYSDKAARKYVPRFNEEKLISARRHRRWFSLVIAALSFLISYFLSPTVYKLSFFSQ